MWISRRRWDVLCEIMARQEATLSRMVSDRYLDRSEPKSWVNPAVAAPKVIPGYFAPVKPLEAIRPFEESVPMMNL